MASDPRNQERMRQSTRTAAAVRFNRQPTNLVLENRLIDRFTVDGVLQESLMQWVALHMQVMLMVSNPWTDKVKSGGEAIVQIWLALCNVGDCGQWKKQIPLRWPFDQDLEGVTALIKSLFKQPFDSNPSESERMQYTKDVKKAIRASFNWVMGHCRKDESFGPQIDSVGMPQLTDVDLFALAFYSRQRSKKFVDCNSGMDDYVLNKQGVLAWMRWTHTPLAYFSAISTYLYFDVFALHRCISLKSKDLSRLKALNHRDLAEITPLDYGNSERNQEAWTACVESLIRFLIGSDLHYGEYLNIEFSLFRLQTAWFRRGMLKNLPNVRILDSSVINELFQRTEFFEFARSSALLATCIWRFQKSPKLEANLPHRLSQCLLALSFEDVKSAASVFNEAWRKIGAFSETCSWHSGREIANWKIHEYRCGNGTYLSAFFDFWDTRTQIKRSYVRKRSPVVNCERRSFKLNYYSHVVRACSWTDSRISGIKYPSVEPSESQVDDSLTRLAAMPQPLNEAAFTELNSKFRGIQVFEKYFEQLRTLIDPKAGELSFQLRNIQLFKLDRSAVLDLANSAQRRQPLGGEMNPNVNSPMTMETSAQPSSPSRESMSVCGNSGSFWTGDNGDSFWAGRISFEALKKHLQCVWNEECPDEFDTIESWSDSSRVTMDRMRSLVESLCVCVSDSSKAVRMQDGVLAYLDSHIVNSKLRQQFWSVMYEKIREMHYDSETDGSKDRNICAVSVDNTTLNVCSEFLTLLTTVDRTDPWLIGLIKTMHNFQTVLLKKLEDGESLRYMLSTGGLNEAFEGNFSTEEVSRVKLERLGMDVVGALKQGVESASVVMGLSRSISRSVRLCQLLKNWFARMTLGNLKCPKLSQEISMSINSVLKLFRNEHIDALMSRLQGKDALMKRTNRQFGELIFRLAYHSREEIIHCFTLRGTRSVNMDHAFYLLCHNISLFVRFAELVCDHLPAHRQLSTATTRTLDRLKVASVSEGYVTIPEILRLWQEFGLSSLLPLDHLKLVLYVCQFVCLSDGNLVQTMLATELMPRNQPGSGDLTDVCLLADDSNTFEGATSHIRHPLDGHTPEFFGNDLQPVATVSMFANLWCSDEHAIVAMIRRKGKPRGLNYDSFDPQRQAGLNLELIRERLGLSEEEWPPLPADSHFDRISTRFFRTKKGKSQKKYVQPYTHHDLVGYHHEWKSATRHTSWYLHIEGWYVQFFVNDKNKNYSNDLMEWTSLIEEQCMNASAAEFFCQYWSRDSSVRAKSEETSASWKESDNPGVGLAGYSEESDSLHWPHLLKSMYSLTKSSMWDEYDYLKLVSYLSAEYGLAKDGVRSVWLKFGSLMELQNKSPNTGIEVTQSMSPTLDPESSESDASSDRGDFGMIGERLRRISDYNPDETSPSPVGFLKRSKYGSSSVNMPPIMSMCSRISEWKVMDPYKLRALTVVYSRGRITPAEWSTLGFVIVREEIGRILFALRGDRLTLAEAAGLKDIVTVTLVEYLSPRTLWMPHLSEAGGLMPDRWPVLSQRQSPSAIRRVSATIFEGDSSVQSAIPCVSSAEKRANYQGKSKGCRWRSINADFFRAQMKNETGISVMQRKKQEQLEDIQKEAARIPGLRERLVFVNECPRLCSENELRYVCEYPTRAFVFLGSTDDCVDYWSSLKCHFHLDSVFDGDEYMGHFTKIYTTRTQGINEFWERTRVTWDGSKRRRIFAAESRPDILPCLESLIKWAQQRVQLAPPTVNPLAPTWNDATEVFRELWQVGEAERSEPHELWGFQVNLLSNPKDQKLQYVEVKEPRYERVKAVDVSLNTRFPLNRAHLRGIDNVLRFRKMVITYQPNDSIGQQPLPRFDPFGNPVTVRSESDYGQHRPIHAASNIQKTATFMGIRISKHQRMTMERNRRLYYARHKTGQGFLQRIDDFHARRKHQLRFSEKLNVGHLQRNSEASKSDITLRFEALGRSLITIREDRNDANAGAEGEGLDQNETNQSDLLSQDTVEVQPRLELRSGRMDSTDVPMEDSSRLKLDWTVPSSRRRDLSSSKIVNQMSDDTLVEDSDLDKDMSVSREVSESEEAESEQKTVRRKVTFELDGCSESDVRIDESSNRAVLQATQRAEVVDSAEIDEITDLDEYVNGGGQRDTQEDVKTNLSVENEISSSVSLFQTAEGSKRLTRVGHTLDDVNTECSSLDRTLDQISEMCMDPLQTDPIEECDTPLQSDQSDIENVQTDLDDGESGDEIENVSDSRLMKREETIESEDEEDDVLGLRTLSQRAKKISGGRKRTLGKMNSTTVEDSKDDRMQCSKKKQRRETLEILREDGGSQSTTEVWTPRRSLRIAVNQQKKEEASRPRDRGSKKSGLKKTKKGKKQSKRAR